MEDQSNTPTAGRRNSIAGPWLRRSEGIPEEYRPAGSAAPGVAPSAPTTTPAPLTRASTVSGTSWLENWFGRRGSLSSSTSLPKRPEPIEDDSHAHLAASAPQAKSRDSIDADASHPAAGQAPASSPTAAAPPLKRRLSEVSLQKAGVSTKVAPAKAIVQQAAVEAPAAGANNFTDIRPGPIETDLFWLVLRDIGE